MGGFFRKIVTEASRGGVSISFYSDSNNGSREDNRKIEQCPISGKA